MSYCSLGAVSTAIYTALNVSGLTSLATGGVGADMPQTANPPFVLFEVHETQGGGLGTRPGVSSLPEVDVRVRVFSASKGPKEAHTIMAKVIELLATPPAVTGYSSWAIFHDSTTLVTAELVGGVKVYELVAQLRLYVEEA